jgi:predicted DNA binding protein
MRYLIFSLMLAAAAHAITCTEGLMLYYKTIYSFFFNEDGAILDSTYISSLDGIFQSEKIVREDDRILVVYSSNEEGSLQSDTNLYFYLINDINSPADSSIAFSKSVIGDTTFIDAITDEPDGVDDPHISRQKIKLFKNGLINDSFEEEPGDTTEDYLELTLKNDTLFRLSLQSVDGAPMDTVNYHFYVADKDDDHLCHDFYRVDHCNGGCSDDKGNVIHNGDILQSYEQTIKETASGFVIEEFRSEKWTYQYFMTYTDGRATTSIAKRPVARMKQPSRNYYFDTKGRKVQKAVPYRVQF